MTRKKAPLTRDEELQAIAAHISAHGVYRASPGEESGQGPLAVFRNYKKKRAVTSKSAAAGKRRTRNGPIIAARERAHAASGGLLSV